MEKVKKLAVVPVELEKKMYTNVNKGVQIPSKKARKKSVATPIKKVSSIKRKKKVQWMQIE